MPDLDLASRITRNPDLIGTEMDGETVIMSIERGEYYGLNQVGSRIWELLEEPMRIDELCIYLEQEFDIDTERCRNETRDFLLALLEQGLVRQL